MNNQSNWKKVKTLTKITSDWLTIFCETWNDGTKDLEYWRVEKDSSLIIITHTRDHFILPKIQFRPGVNETTLDFPGGRYDGIENERDVAKQILMRELNLSETNILSLEKISNERMFVNSSFNNQTLIIYTSQVNIEHTDPNYIIYKKDNYPLLLRKLNCLQCNFSLRLWSDNPSR